MQTAINIKRTNIKDQVMKIVDIGEFGFCGWGEMWISLARPMNFKPLIAISVGAGAISSVCEKYFGLSFIALALLACIITLELVTGITAAKLRGEKIKSRRLHRFGFKLIIWFFFLFMFFSFKTEFKGGMSSYIFDYLHSFVIYYIIGVYTWSVIENLGSMGREYEEFKIFGKKIKKKLKELSD